MSNSSASYYIYRTPYGPVTISTAGDAVTGITFGQASGEGTQSPSAVANRCATQLQEYFAGHRSSFDIPIAPSGSDFQQAVWVAVGNVPYGQTRTTAEIAEVIGKPASFRSVGAAVRANPIPVLIPTHRIVTGRGKPLGDDGRNALGSALLSLEARYRMP